MTDEQRKALGLLSTKEIAKLLEVTPKTVLNRLRRLHNAGFVGVGIRLGRDWFYTAKDMEALKDAPDKRRKGETPSL